jgi:hypothetical protein
MRLHRLPIRAGALALATVAALALPASGFAAAPFSGLGSTSSSTTTTSTSSTTTAPPVALPTTTSSGLSTLAYLGIGVVAIAIFATIIYVIRRDARIHAPRHAVREIDKERGTVAPRTERIKRSRAKAKAARRARRSRR